MAKQSVVQPYPRIEEGERFSGFLDDNKLTPHKGKIEEETLKKIILAAIEYANAKSSREMQFVPLDSDEEAILKHHKASGKSLFAYFKTYTGDPASTAFDCSGRHYTTIAQQQFRNRTVQKERMNSGWRYQAIAKEAAIKSKRFVSVSDIGTAEADFNVVIKVTGVNTSFVTIYVSVKNRTNTMGGQDWPKAIHALENVAKADKNREGPYLCVFGIAIDKGLRNIKASRLTKQPHSFNTEVWLSDFFWPFFGNITYDEIMKAVLKHIIDTGTTSSLDVVIPAEVIDSFGSICDEYGLLDETGHFNDPFLLVDLFCGKLKVPKKKNS